MPYPKKTVNVFRFSLCILVLLLYLHTHAQDAPIPFISGSFRPGTSFALGSLSKNSGDQNDYGKFYWALSTDLAADFIFKEKYTIGLAYKLSDITVTDGKARSDVQQRLGKSYSPDFNDYGITLQFYSIGASYLFRFSKFVIQPKMNLTMAVGSYDFADVQMIPYSSSPIPNQGYTYKYGTSGGSVGFTLIPELNIQYLILRKTYVDLALNLGANYTSTTLRSEVVEEESKSFSNTPASVSSFTKLEDRVSLLNIHAGISLYIKRRSRNE